MGGAQPGVELAALSMMAMALAMAGSGLAMASGVAPPWVKEAHEVVANVFLALVLLHLAGLAVHVLRYRDALPSSMVSGRKRDLPAGTAAVPSRPIAALVMLAVLAATGVYLVRAYDPATRGLDLFGTHLVLGENDGESRDGVEPRGAAGGHEGDEARGDD